MEHGGMRDLRARAATAGAALAGVLALAGCTDPSEVDTAPLISAIEQVPGVDDAIVSLKWDGLPTDDNVVMDLWVYAPDAEGRDSAALTTLVEDIMFAAWTNSPMRPTDISFGVTAEPIPADTEPWGDDVSGMVPIHEEVSAALGGDPDGPEFYPSDAALEARFGPWEKP